MNIIIESFDWAYGGLRYGKTGMKTRLPTGSSCYSPFFCFFLLNVSAIKKFWSHKRILGESRYSFNNFIMAQVWGRVAGNWRLFVKLMDWGIGLGVSHSWICDQEKFRKNCWRLVYRNRVLVAEGRICRRYGARFVLQKEVSVSAEMKTRSLLSETCYIV